MIKRRLRVFDLCTPWFWLVTFYKRQYAEPWFSLAVYPPRGRAKWWFYLWQWEDDPSHACGYTEEWTYENVLKDRD